LTEARPLLPSLSLTLSSPPLFPLLLLLLLQEQWQW
jgi:hypothetical protein